MKRYKKGVVLGLLMFLAFFLACVEQKITSGLSTQQLAKRWSNEEEYAQLACYFAETAYFEEEQIPLLQRAIVTGLEEAAITSAKENGGRNWLDAYSTQGELVIASNRASMSARAFGVGGDFFRFHPLTLLDGSYFDSSDINADGVIIDEMVAWQLFGSSQVAGMEVEINGTIYPVRGVVRSDKGLFSEAVKEEAPTIYVSFAILEGEEALFIDCYELLALNPVKSFAKDTLEMALAMSEEQYELVECSARYDLAHRFSVIKNFGIRSMTTKNMVFPYWENRARGYEDVSALILVLQILCLIYPVLWLCRMGYRLWKRRKEMRKKFWESMKGLWKKSGTLLKNKKKTDKVNKKKQKEA